MKATLAGRRHAAAGRKAKRRPVRRAHAPRRHKRHAAPAAGAAAAGPVVLEATIVETEAETPFFGIEADKREEDLSDEEMLDREERQHLY